MAAISRLRCAWTGPGVVGGGLSTFYSEGDPLQLQLALKTFFSGTVMTALPSTVTITVPASGETLESTTGTLTGGWTAGTAQTTSGSSSAVYPAGVGCRVVWETAGVTRGRRVRGSTYLVPFAGNMYDLDGSILNSVRTSLQTAAEQVIVAMGDDMVVFSRPKGGAPGMIWTVQSAALPDKVSWLRSRRT
jgi:hypothetical protein